eukprot:967127-Prymnesium_polylepis.1
MGGHWRRPRELWIKAARVLAWPKLRAFARCSAAHLARSRRTRSSCRKRGCAQCPVGRTAASTWRPRAAAQRSRRRRSAEGTASAKTTATSIVSGTTTILRSGLPRPAGAIAK